MLELRSALVALITLPLSGCAAASSGVAAFAGENPMTDELSRTDPTRTDPMWRMDFGLPLVASHLDEIPTGAESVECDPEDSAAPGLNCEFKLDSVRFEVMSDEIFRKCAVLEDRVLPFGLNVEDDPPTVIRRLNALQSGLVFASSSLPGDDGIYVGAISGSEILDVVQFYVLFSNEGHMRELCIRISNV